MKKRKYANRGGWIPLVLGLLLFAAVAVWMVSGVWEAAQVSDRKSVV